MKNGPENSGSAKWEIVLMVEFVIEIKGNKEFPE